MNRIHLYIYFFSLLLLLTAACKEDYVDPVFFGSLQGQVLNSADLTPLENAIVQVTQTSASVLTDAEGKFAIDNLPVGGYTLEVRLQGFGKELLSVEVAKDKATELNVLLDVDLSPNTAPSMPMAIAPANLATGLANSLSLAWQSSDEDAEDELSYTVYFFKEGENSQTPFAEGIMDTTLLVEGLSYGATYYWQVAVSDGQADPVFGPIWSFSTMPFPQHRFRWIRKVDGIFQIFSSDLNGNPIQVSNSLIGAWRPKLSPDRQKIAFLSSDGISTHLFAMDVDGSNVQQLTHAIPVAGVEMMEVDFCWSPNGARLLYPSNDKLFSISQDGTDLQLVATAPSGKQFASVDWAENGNKKVVRLTGNNAYESEIYLLDNANALSLLVADEPGKTGNPVFSLDGTKILYTHDVSGFQNLEGRQLDSHVFLMDLASSQTTDISTGKTAGTNDLDPDFSPTDSEIIFTNTPNDGISSKTLVKAMTNGQNRAMVLDNAEMGDWH